MRNLMNSHASLTHLRCIFAMFSLNSKLSTMWIFCDYGLNHNMSAQVVHALCCYWPDVVLMVVHDGSDNHPIASSRLFRPLRCAVFSFLHRVQGSLSASEKPFHHCSFHSGPHGHNPIFLCCIHFQQSPRGTGHGCHIRARVQV